MTSGSSFFWARTRSGVRALLALAVITTIAALLLGSLIGAVRAFENAGLMDAVERASGDRGYLIVTFPQGANDDQAPAIEEALREIGAAGALSIESAGEGRFVLSPDPVHFSGDAAIALTQGIAQLPREIRNAGGGDAQVAGGLRSTLATLVDGINTRRGPTSMAIGIVALLAVVVVAAAAVEPVRQRLDERALLRARGMAKGRLARLALGETIPVLILSSALAAAGAYAATLLWSGTIMPLWPLIAIAVGLPLVGALSAVFATLRGVDRRSVRADALAGVTALILLAVLAGLAAWQFWRTGTAVMTLGNGQVAIDPLIALAPALGLALFALLAVVLARPVAALLALPAAAGRRLRPVLPLRLASRRSGRHALTTGAVAFASATISLAIVYQGSLEALGSVPEDLRVGTDVRVISVRDDADRATITALDGIDETMRARVLGVRDPSGNYPMLVVESPQLGAVMLDVNGQIDPAELGEALKVAPFGVEIPATATALAVTVQVPPERYIDEYGELVDFVFGEEGEEWVIASGGVAARITLMDSSGALSQFVTSNVEILSEETSPEGYYRDIFQHVSVTEEHALSGTGPWRVIAIDGWQEHFSGPDIAMEVLLEAEGQRLDLSGLEGPGALATTEMLSILVKAPEWPTYLPIPARAAAIDAPSHYPLVITQRLADSMGVAIGTRLSLRLASFPLTLDTEVVRIVPLIPGLIDGAGVMVGLTALALSSEDPPMDNEMWLATEDPPAVAEAVDAALTGIRIDTLDPRAGAKAFETVLAFLMAAAGAVGLAIVVMLLRRSRSGDGTERELGTLAVLGLGRRGAARVRAAEDAFAIIMGVLGGVAAGLAVAWLIVPSLARSVYAGMSESYPVEMVVPWLPLGIAVLAATGVFVVIAASVRAPRSLSRVMREAE